MLCYSVLKQLNACGNISIYVQDLYVHDSTNWNLWNLHELMFRITKNIIDTDLFTFLFTFFSPCGIRVLLEGKKKFKQINNVYATNSAVGILTGVCVHS